MKILHFQAGLGNQMFQFAFFRHMQSLGYNNIVFDTSSPSMRHHNGFELKRIFPNIARLDNYMPGIIARPLFLLGDVSKKVFKRDCSTDCGDIAHPVVPKGKLWLRGFWQEYAYIDSIRNQLLSDFSFVPINDSHNAGYAKQIESTESVSIHIRRGDYLKPHQRITFGDICTVDYYKEAASLILSKTENPVFFVFSDDINWVKQHLELPQAVYVEGNSGKNSFRDMQLMSLCKHNIIANSSFSWWGAWLNTNPDKIVTAPAKWFNNHAEITANTLIPPTWARIGAIRPNVSLMIDYPVKIEDIQTILAQKYIDFEILLSAPVEIDDPRIIINRKPIGNHIFKIDSNELSCFKNKKYLKRKLKQYFQDPSK